MAGGNVSCCYSINKMLTSSLCGRQGVWSMCLVVCFADAVKHALVLFIVQLKSKH
jgi:hypothetical protein